MKFLWQPNSVKSSDGVVSVQNKLILISDKLKTKPVINYI